MTRLIQTIGGILVLTMAQSGLACDYPERVNVPNGTTASIDEMRAGMKDVETFKAAMQAYLTCIVEEEKAARAAIDDLAPEIEQQREEMLTKKYNAAVEDEERLVAAINAEIRAYKESNE